MFWQKEKNSFFSRVSCDFRFSRKMALSTCFNVNWKCEQWSYVIYGVTRVRIDFWTQGYEIGDSQRPWKNAQTKLLAWLAAKEWARWNKIRPKRKEDLPVKALVPALKKIQHHYHFPRLSLHSPDFFHGCRMLVRFQAFFQKSKNCINALCINTTFNLANSLFTKLYQRNNVNC